MARFHRYSVFYKLRCSQTIFQNRTGLIEKQEVSQKHYLGPENGVGSIILSTDYRGFSGPEFLYKKEEDWPQRKWIKVEERSADHLAEIAKSKTTFNLQRRFPRHG